MVNIYLSTCDNYSHPAVIEGSDGLSTVSEGSSSKNMGFATAVKALVFVNKILKFRESRQKALVALPPESKLNRATNGQFEVRCVSMQDASTVSQAILPTLQNWMRQLLAWQYCCAKSPEDQGLIADSLFILEGIVERCRYSRDYASWTILTAIEKNDLNELKSGNVANAVQAIGLCEIKEKEKSIIYHYLATAPRNLRISSSIKGDEPCFRGAGTATIRHLLQKAVFYRWESVITYPLANARSFYFDMGFKPFSRKGYRLDVPNIAL